MSIFLRRPVQSLQGSSVSVGDVFGDGVTDDNYQDDEDDTTDAAAADDDDDNDGENDWNVLEILFIFLKM